MIRPLALDAGRSYSGLLPQQRLRVICSSPQARSCSSSSLPSPGFNWPQPSAGHLWWTGGPLTILRSAANNVAWPRIVSQLQGEQENFPNNWIVVPHHPPMNEDGRFLCSSNLCQNQVFIVLHTMETALLHAPFRSCSLPQNMVHLSAFNTPNSSTVFLTLLSTLRIPCAPRSRERKKEQMVELEARLSDLEAENNGLRAMLQSMMTENTSLKEQLASLTRGAAAASDAQECNPKPAVLVKCLAIMHLVCCLLLCTEASLRLVVPSLSVLLQQGGLAGPSVDQCAAVTAGSVKEWCSRGKCMPVPEWWRVRIRPQVLTPG